MGRLVGVVDLGVREGGGWAYVLSRRTLGSQCSEGSGGGGFKGCTGIWDGVCVGDSV